MRERAISPPPDVAVARNGLTERRCAGGGKGVRADIAVDVDVKSFLEEARGCGDAVVDGGIEVHECERSAERGAVRGVPVAADVDVADERMGIDCRAAFSAANFSGVTSMPRSRA